MTKKRSRGKRRRSPARNSQPRSLDRSLLFEVLESRRLLTVDFGDAPAPYPSLLADGGPSHGVIGPQLGPTRTTDADATPSAGANADAGDDGVTFGEIRAGDLQASVAVEVFHTDGKLDAWIDFNGDGVWGGPDEQIFDSTPVTRGVNPLTFHAPAGAKPGQTFARFRISLDGGLGVGGEVFNGEVEDYQLTISPPKSSGATFFNELIVSESFSGVTDVIAADLGGDGDLDVVSANESTNQITRHFNIGNFEYSASSSGSVINGRASIIAADVDGDGDIDLVTSSADDHTIAWYENGLTRHVISTTAFGAQSVFAVDFDGDGDMDVLSASSLDDEIILYSNNGAQSFVPLTISRVANGARDVFAADVDRDGDIDVLSASSEDNRIAWFENNGTANFVVHNISTNAQGARSVFAADMDGDGDIDVLSGSYEDNTIAWHENDGQQNFTRRVISSNVLGVEDVSAADLNGDGYLDVLSASSLDNTVAWYRNNGAGSFTPRVISSSALGAVRATAGDIDGDGDLDVLSASRDSGRIVWHQNSSGVAITSAEATISEAGGEPLVYSIDAAEPDPEILSVNFVVTSSVAREGVDYTLVGAKSFDGARGVVEIPAGETHVELVVVPIDNSLLELDKPITITLVEDASYTLLGLGSSTQAILSDEYGADFGDAPAPFRTKLSQHGASHFQSSADSPRLGSSVTYESDGQANSQANADAGDDGVTFGTLNAGQLDATLTVNVQGGAGKIDAWIDFNGDGSWDGPNERLLAGASVSVGDNLLSFDVPSWAKPGATYSRVRISSTGNLGPGGLALDGEVEDQIVTITTQGVGGGSIGPAKPIAPFTSHVRSLDSADIDGDGDLDFFYGFDSSGAVGWLENDGSQNFSQHEVGHVSSRSGNLVAADLDGDNDIDLLAASNSNKRLEWFENDGTQQFTRRIVSEEVQGVSNIAVADVDGDGDLDVLATLSTSDSVYWYDNDGAQNFTPRIIATDADGASSVFAVDIDHDGDLDVLSTSELDDKISWYENDGSQGFNQHVVTASADGAARVLAADFDGDGDVDIVAASWRDSTIAIYENDGAENFTPTVTTSTAFSSVELAIADIDGDGDLDLLSSSPSHHSVTWHENEGHLQFKTRVITTSADIVRGVLAADVDGDGDLDVVSAARGEPSAVVWYENVYGAEIQSPEATLSEAAGESLSYTITVLKNVLAPTAISFTVSQEATFGTDYILTGADSFDGIVGVATIPAGSSSIELVIEPVDDTRVEYDEPVTITLLPGDDYTIRENASTTQTITSREDVADFGDAPLPYPTSLDNGGAVHQQTPDGPRLGSTISYEADGQTDVLANGDDHEDGVTFGAVRVGRLGATVTVNVQGEAGLLSGWIDFDADGSWGGIQEKVFADLPVVVGDNVLRFNVPVWAVSGDTYARFRISTAGDLAPAGIADDGEVEDYRITIAPPVRTIGRFATETPVIADSPYTFEDVIVVDLDQDGDNDFVPTNTNNEETHWYENRGPDGFQPHPLGLIANHAVAADMDRDGDIDLAIIGRPLASSSTPTYLMILENDGNQEFTHRNLATLDSRGKAITTADFNNDGLLDLAALHDSGGFTTLISTNSGDYVPQLVEISSSTADIDSADVNRDGNIDIFVSYSSVFGRGSHLFLGHGDGLFTATALNVPSGDDLFEAELADIDGDGDLDIVGRSYFVTTELKWFEQTDDGEFIAHQIHDFSSLGLKALEVADFDGDGDQDVVALNDRQFENPRIEWFENNGTGDFLRHEFDVNSFEYALEALAKGDIDGNGTIDLIINSIDEIAYLSQPLPVSVVALTPMATEDDAIVIRLSIDVPPDNSFSIPFTLSGTALPEVDYTVESGATLTGADGIATIAAGATHVDVVLQPVADGIPELAETIVVSVVGQPNATATTILLGDPDFGDYGDAPAPYPVTGSPLGAAHIARGPRLGATRTTEAQGTSSTDATADPGDDGVTFGVLQVGSTNAAVTVDVQNATEDAFLDAWIDFNQDGSWGGADERIFQKVPVTPGVNFLRFAIPASATSGVTYARFRLSTAGTLGPGGNAFDGEVEDYQMEIAPPHNSPATFVESDPIAGEFLSIAAVAADIDRDGDLDVFSIARHGAISWHENLGAEGWSTTVIGGVSVTIPSLGDLAVVDVDNDGDLDILASAADTFRSNGEAGLVWLENDAFTFTTHWFDGPAATDFAIGDVDSDGDIDIVSPSIVRTPRSFGHTIELILYENEGDGVFSTTTIQELAYEADEIGGVDLADLDRDGDLDIVVAGDSEVDVDWFRNDGAGRFTRRGIVNGPADRFHSNSGRPAVKVADVDGDGDSDILVSPTYHDPEFVWYENQGDETFVKRIIARRLIRAYDINVADVDGDGDLDALYAYGFGNSKLFVWGENRLAGDYNDDGAVDDLDYTFWKRHFGATDGEGLQADGNQDGVVNGADYAYWREQKDQTGGHRTFQLQPASHYLGRSVFPADIDGDGDIDLLSPHNFQTGPVWSLNVPAVNLEVEGDEIVEASETSVSVTVTRARHVDAPLDVNFNLSGSALAGIDYALVGADLDGQTGVATIPVGAESATFTIVALNDSLAELAETFSIELVGSIEYTVEQDEAFLVKIHGDEIGGDFGDAPFPFPTTLTQDGALALDIREARMSV